MGRWTQEDELRMERMSESRTQPTLGQLTRRCAERLILGAVMVVVLAYAIDVAVFFARGKPADQITVNHSLAVPLKGNKTEYDFEASEQVVCSRSLFPQGGHTPCWYLRRHTNQTDQI